MFGPNTALSMLTSVESSHRGQGFQRLFSKVSTQLTRRFSLQDFDLLMIPGSSTFGMECLVWSFKGRLNVVGNPEGRWIQRWSSLVELHQSPSSQSEASDCIDLSCAFETSISGVDLGTGGIVDAVSSFPYFDLPDAAIAFVTCPNKLLGALAGFSIVGVKKSQWHRFASSEVFSTLNLSRYLEYSKLNQTPSTPPVAAIASLARSLSSLDVQGMRDVVRLRGKEILSAVGEDNIIGSAFGPVLNIHERAFAGGIVEDFELYRGSAYPEYVSIFLYSEPEEKYRKLIDILGGSAW